MRKHPARGFTYRPRRRELVAWERLRRQWLVSACLEEARCGGGLPALYAGLLARAVGEADESLREEFGLQDR